MKPSFIYSALIVVLSFCSMAVSAEEFYDDFYYQRGGWDMVQQKYDYNGLAWDYTFTFAYLTTLVVDNYLQTKEPITDLSSVKLQLQRTDSQNPVVLVQISEDAIAWNDVKSITNLTLNNWEDVQVPLPSIGNYYLRLSVSCASTTKVLLDKIYYYTTPRPTCPNCFQVTIE